MVTNVVVVVVSLGLLTVEVVTTKHTFRKTDNIKKKKKYNEKKRDAEISITAPV